MSTNNNSSNIRSGTIGTPKYATEKKTISFLIHDFENLEDKEKAHFSSPLECHGYKWSLGIFPFGDDEETKKEEFVSVYIHCEDCSNASSVYARYAFHGAGIAKETSKYQQFDYDHDGWGCGKFAKRSELLEGLNGEGALTISVEIQVKKQKLVQWRPPSIQSDLIQLYDNGEMVDVTFAIGDYVVRAHKLVLSLRSPTLFEMAEEASNQNNNNNNNNNNEGGVTKVELPTEGVDADLFAMMIRFLYANCLPDYFNLENDGMELLKLSDRFGCSTLKMYLEAEFVESDFITKTNAAEILLLSDSHSCALLKEKAMDVIAANFSDIIVTDGWKDLKQSADLLAEVWEYQATRSAGASTENPQEESVSGMRKRLAESGQDVDGTKETLAKRLKSTVE